MASPGHNALIRIHSFEHQIVSVIGEYAMESAIFPQSMIKNLAWIHWLLMIIQNLS